MHQQWYSHLKWFRIGKIKDEEGEDGKAGDFNIYSLLFYFLGKGFFIPFRLHFLMMRFSGTNSLDGGQVTIAMHLSWSLSLCPVGRFIC